MTENKRPRVVIIGAGFGGLSTAQILAKKEVDVDMLLTTPFCPYAPWMVQQVKEKTEMATPGWTADVEVLAKQWDPSMMEDPDLLGFGMGGW